MTVQTLGSYELIEPLGAGGMGQVYRARDTTLQRDVAIKIVPPELARNAEHVERLQREARILASIDHPNINTIYAVEEIDGARFLVLQLIEGVTLAARLAQGRLALEEALGTGLQVADALEAAHAKGIVHRDLKPANVMISDDGRVRVLDFGIAKATNPAEPSDLSVGLTRSQLTRAGTVLGSAPYMSPEQLRGDPVDARTDIWAFGCLLYEMLSGKRAFGRDTVADTGAAILTRDPDWDALPDALPSPFVRLTQHCLRKDANERLRSIADARVALRALLDWESRPQSSPVAAAATDSVGGSPTVGAARRLWLPLAAVGALLLAVGAYRVTVGPLTSSPDDRAFRLADQRLATVGPGSHRQPTLSPDGTTMAFVSDATGIPRIVVQTLTEGAAPIPITDESAPAFHPSWSPTTAEIVFYRPNDGIWTVGPLGTPAPRRILEAGINPSFSWDGAQIVYERFPRVWMANADGTDPRPVEGADLVMPTAVQNVVGGFPALSPDGESIVYFRSASGPMGDFWIVPASGGEPRRLTFDTNQASHPVWTPDGRFVVFSSLRSGSRTLWRIPVAGGDPEPVTSGAGEDSEPAISRDGRRLVYSNVRNERAMMIYDPGVGESRELLARRYGLVHPRFSPDGESIVFFGEVAGGTDLFVVGSDGQNLRPVTRGTNEFNIHPQWSPSGSMFYFYRDNPYRQDSPGEFLKIPVAGGPGEVVLPGFYWDLNMYADLHPDETAVTYTRIGAGPEPPTTFIRELESGLEQALETPVGWDTDRPFHLHFPRWSHDGEYIAGSDLGSRWRSGGGGGNWIWVCPVEDVCESVVEGFFPVWSADDSQLYFYRSGPAPAMLRIWVAGRDGRDGRQVTEIGPIHPISPNIDLSPDGRIVWIQNREGRPEIWSAAVE